jgi:hypothetical protein
MGSAVKSKSNVKGSDGGSASTKRTIPKLDGSHHQAGRESQSSSSVQSSGGKGMRLGELITSIVSNTTSWPIEGARFWVSFLLSGRTNIGLTECNFGIFSPIPLKRPKGRGTI